MQHDEVIWGILNTQFCSFKSRLRHGKGTFCRNPYSVNGLCNQRSCPLANSQYATIRELDGVVYLYMKTIERAHSPKNLWERVKLSKNYARALEQIDASMEYWAPRLIHKNKQRLTKIHQYLIRMRKLTRKTKPKQVVINKKIERRENRREVKAKIAAKLETSIENELLTRLQKGTYGDIYNFPEKEYSKVMQTEGEEEEFELEDDEEEEDEEEEDNGVEFVEDDFEEEESDIEDMEGPEMSSDDDDDENIYKKKRKLSKSSSTKGPYVEVEYEQEEEEGHQMVATNSSGATSASATAW